MAYTDREPGQPRNHGITASGREHAGSPSKHGDRNGSHRTSGCHTPAAGDVARRIPLVLAIAALASPAAGCGPGELDTVYGRDHFESQCGTTWDADPVERPSSDLPLPVEFIRRHSPAVGWIGNCSGTLLGRDLFLTAAHCVSPGALPAGAVFNYQNDPQGNPRDRFAFPVVEVVEHGNGGLDYAILRLKGNPGERIAPANIATTNCAPGDRVAVIGHPGGRAKQVAAGTIRGIEPKDILYRGLDTSSGNSGSGVICGSNGRITGVHAWGGCNQNPGVSDHGSNGGPHIEALLDASPVLRSLRRFPNIFAGEACPQGARPARADEVTRNMAHYCKRLGPGHTARLADGASLSAVDDTCKVLDQDGRRLQHALCVADAQPRLWPEEGRPGPGIAGSPAFGRRPDPPR